VFNQRRFALRRRYIGKTLQLYYNVCFIFWIHFPSNLVYNCVLLCLVNDNLVVLVTYWLHEGGASYGCLQLAAKRVANSARTIYTLFTEVVMTCTTIKGRASHSSMTVMTGQSICFDNARV
jgi:hypothetical protein